MKLAVYSIHDKITKSYSQPIICSDSEKDIVAIRLFATMVTPDSMLYKMPRDYQFIKIGYYDDEAGILISADHEYICDAEDMKDKDFTDSYEFIEDLKQNYVRYN